MQTGRFERSKNVRSVTIVVQPRQIVITITSGDETVVVIVPKLG